MAITKAQIAAIPDYTDAEMVKLCKLGLTQIQGGSQSYSINGRTFTRANLKDLEAHLTFWEERVAAAASSTGTNIALAEFIGP